MNTATSFRYQLNDCKWAVAIFYIVIFMIFISAGITLSAQSLVEVTTSGLEGSTLLFLYIVAMNTFRSNFLSHLQFGATRKTLFKGWLASAATISFGMTIFNTLVILICQLIHFPIDSPIFSFEIESLPLRVIIGSIQLFANNFMGMTLGYLTTIGFYRLNKIGKWIAGLTIGGVFFVLGPISDHFDTVIEWLFTLPYQQPVLFTGIYLLISAVVLLFCWILIRNMPAKSN